MNRLASGAAGSFCESAAGRVGGADWCMAIVVRPVETGDLSALVPSDVVRLVTAAYLARFKGDSRAHSSSDLSVFLTWCAGREVEPMTATRVHLELYVRWMQDTRHFAAATVSRRVSVITGFYRTAVIDGVLENSPAEDLRRPRVPPESPTLGLTHLQFEAMLATARLSSNLNDFALVTMLGLLGLRIFEATGLDISDLR